MGQTFNDYLGLQQKSKCANICISVAQCSVSIPVLFFFFGEFLLALERIEETKIASEILNLAKEDYSFYNVS